MTLVSVDMISLLPAIALLLTSYNAHIVVQGKNVPPDLVQGVLGQKVGAPLLKYAKIQNMQIG